MLCTEDEARTKWCPFSKQGGEQTCIASECMAWRWSEAKRTKAFLDAVQAYMRAMEKPDHNKAVQAVYAESGRQFECTEGFCGLAGRLG